MDLPLITTDVWAVEDRFTASTLFSALEHLIDEHIILTIGSYNVCKEIREFLESKAFVLNTEAPYQHFFEVNRREFPNGRPYDLEMNTAILQKLNSYCSHPQGGVDKDLFFDHLVAFKIGLPILPLVFFHDAFNGGSLYLSGHYSESDINHFLKALGCSAKLVVNPANLCKSYDPTIPSGMPTVLEK